MNVPRSFLLFLFASALAAAEHHGVVKSGGLPLPGVTITATMGDKKSVTTTDERGAYSFTDLADGVWTLEIDSFGFAKLREEVAVAPNAPSPEWDLKLLSLAALKQQLAPQQETAAQGRGGFRRQGQAPGAPGGGFQGRGGFPGRGPGGPTGGQGTGPGGRPSLAQAAGQNGRNPETGFQRLGVNAAADGALLDGENTGGNGPADGFAGGDLNQSAANALIVNGSVSSGLDAPQQNDWFGFGRGGFDGFGGGPGGPGGPGGDAQALAAGGQVPGGPGGGFGGPGGFAGPGGPGGRGGFGGPGGRGGFGGQGGRGGNRGGFRGRDPNAFGNGRRNQRQQYNGNLAFIFNNSALDARPYSLTGQDTPKASYSHFRSTGSFGGPLKIPHLLSGKNTFFIVNFQLARNRNGSVVSSLVPTAAERTGDFSQAFNPLTGAPVRIYDPLTGQPFAGNTIPQDRLSPEAQAWLNYYPSANFASSRYNYQTPIVGIGNQTNVNARITQTINAKNQVNGNIAVQRGDTTTPNLFGFVDSAETNGYNATAQWTFHFTTRVTSNLRYNFSRSAVQTTPFFAYQSNVPSAPGSDQSAQFQGPPTLNFSSGFASLTDANFALNHNTTNQIGESLLWVKNKHNLTFGADYRRLAFNQLAQQNPRGSFHFTGSFTGVTGTDGLAAPGAGFDFADFLLGYPGTSSIAYGNADKYFRAAWVDTFFTDDWRVSSKLSLNLGVRWDFQAPVTEKYDRLVNLAVGPNFGTAVPVCGVTATGCVAAGQIGIPDALVRPNYHEVQPRVGLAWRPSGKSTTVVRAGYGIYFNTSVYQPLASQMAQQAPLSFSATQSNSLANPYTLANAFLIPAINSTPQTFALDPNFQIGYLHYWQVSVQHNLTNSLVATLTYNGNKGLHQVQQFLPNSVAPGAPASGLPAGYVYETSNGTSSYNAGSAQLQRRFRSGFAFNAVYTFSKALDDSQAVGGRGSAGSTYAQNWLDLTAERSLSSFNRTHTFNGNIQFSPGQGVRGGALLKGWKGALAKDWTFTTAFQVGSGLPLTPVVLNRVASGTGVTGTVRADVTGLPIYAAPSGAYLNPLAFIAPPPGEWGNAGRNTITGPMLFTMNTSAGRVFRIGERRSIDLRFDATNVLNHVNYNSWNTTVGSAQFGFPTAAGGMRTIQATLRLRF